MKREFSVRYLGFQGPDGLGRYRVQFVSGSAVVTCEVAYEGDRPDAFREAIRDVTGIPEGHLVPDAELGESSTVQRWYTYEEKGN